MIVTFKNAWLEKKKKKILTEAWSIVKHVVNHAACKKIVIVESFTCTRMVKHCA